jgi:dCMP deaminase
MANVSQTRADIIKAAEHFMNIAFIESQKSKDPKTKVGACLVSPYNQIIGVGYNSQPKVKPAFNNDEVFPWTKEEKHKYVCHAELNAFANCSSSVKGSTIYVTHYPCNECAKLIVQSGVKEVIYHTAKNFRDHARSVSNNIFCFSGIEPKKLSDIMEQQQPTLFNFVESMEIDYDGPLC